VNCVCVIVPRRVQQAPPRRVKPDDVLDV
jgi:hypothetical protein